MGAFIDLAGKRFGRLFVAEYAGVRQCADRVRAQWKCICDCGNTCITTTKNLRCGGTQSCGCYQKDRRMESCLKHGFARRETRTREYKAWYGMRARCLSNKSAGFFHYGGRGISICKEWEDFEVFLKDMGKCPDGLTLERIDVNGNYEPKNCKWATVLEQARNKRNNRFIEFLGRIKTLTEWSKETGISIQTLSCRIKSGLSMELVFSKDRIRKQIK